VHHACGAAAARAAALVSRDTTDAGAVLRNRGRSSSTPVLEVHLLAADRGCDEGSRHTPNHPGDAQQVLHALYRQLLVSALTVWITCSDLQCDLVLSYHMQQYMAHMLDCHMVVTLMLGARYLLLPLLGSAGLRSGQCQGPA
jgi:hypothetical protein